MAEEIAWSKEFRFMERVLWSIGHGRPDRGLDDHYDQSPEDVPGFLRCEDTCPDQDAAAAWWREFLGALRGWRQGRPGRGGVADDVNERLGEATPVKRWLVRLYVHRLGYDRSPASPAPIPPVSGPEGGLGGSEGAGRFWCARAGRRQDQDARGPRGGKLARDEAGRLTARVEGSAW